MRIHRTPWPMISLLTVGVGCKCFESEIRVTTSVYTGALPRVVVSATKDRTLARLAELQKHVLQVDEYLSWAEAILSAYDAYVTKTIDGNKELEERHRQDPRYNPERIQRVRELLYNSKVAPSPSTRPKRLAELQWTTFRARADRIWKESAKPDWPAPQSLAAIQAELDADTARLEHSVLTVSLIRHQLKGHTVQSQLGPAAPTAAKLKSVKVSEGLREMVFFGSRTLTTAHGITQTHVLDPADPRLRASTGTDQNAVKLEFDKDENWKVYDSAHAIGDGRSGYVVVQESPLHYRTKEFRNDPSKVVALNLRVLESGINILGSVLGAAGAAYGGAALDKLGLPSTDGAENEDRQLAMAKAEVAAAEASASEATGFQEAMLAPIRSRLATIVEQLEDIDSRLDRSRAPNGRLVASDEVKQLLTRAEALREEAHALMPVLAGALAQSKSVLVK